MRSMVGLLKKLDYRNFVISTVAPTHYWPLDEASGTVANDRGSSPNNATIDGGPALAQTGPGSQAAISLTTSSHFIETGTVTLNSIPNSFTIAIWAYRTSTGLCTLYSFGNTGNPLAVYIDTYLDRWRCGITDSSGNNWVGYHSTPSITNSTWYHVCVTFDSSTSTIILYINGTEAGRSSSTSGTRYQNDGRLWIGRYNSTFSQAFAGKVAHASLSPTVATAAKVLALAQAA